MIFDMQVMSSGNNPPLSQQIETMRILSSNYPERMFKAFFTFQPFIFTMIFNLLWPFLEERQQQKINLLGSSDFSMLREYIDASSLEVKYGGTMEPISFDFEDLRKSIEPASLN
jgi:hypothetical protein